MLLEQLRGKVQATMKPMIAGMVTGVWLACAILYGVPFLIGTGLLLIIGAAATVLAHVSVEIWMGEDDDEQ